MSKSNGTRRSVGADAAECGQENPAHTRARLDQETRFTTLPDGTSVLGDKLGGEIRVEYRTRTPAPDARPRRQEEFPILVAEELRQRAERDAVDPPTPEDVAAEVGRRLAEAAERRLDIAGALSDLISESAAPDAAAVDRGIETAAVVRLPVMVWAWLRLLLYSSGPKKIPMWRRLAVATVFRMGLSSVRPCARRIVEDFCRDNRALAWAHLWPGHPPTARPKDKRWELSALHKQIKGILSPRNPYRMWQATNRHMLLELLGAHTTTERGGGGFANCWHALTYLSVDGFLIEADLPQNKPLSDAHARMIRGEARKRCGFVIYKVRGQITRKCHGYKWMQLSLMKMGGLVLHGKLFPANVDERKATLELIAEAFAYWPELRLQKDIFLVGDALYDNDETFAYELTYRWGIHGVFPRAGRIRSGCEFVEDGGVPRCHCGELATIAEAADFPTPWYRHKRKLPGPGDYIRTSRGEIHQAARIRWRCAKASEHRCDFHQDTYLHQNPRLYTYLPHAGNHRRAAMRPALLCYRNVIESSFASFKEMGLAGQSQARPQWAGDDQMDHLVWMTVVAMTGRRLVHANGLYERVFDEATHMGLLQPSLPTDAREAEFSAAGWAAWARSLKTYATAPTGWPAIDPQDEVHLVPTVA